MAKADKLVKIAEEIGHSPSQVAMNWVRHQD
jgi:aryl-alcohol dehydrogenase-like predicted oxidoreductase